MSLIDRQYVYDVISLALDGVRSDTAQGLTKKLNSFTIITLDGGTLSFRLNSSTATIITASDGLKIEGMPITEIYWTNIAQAGLTAQIFIIWID